MLEWLPLLLVTVTLLSYAVLRARRETDLGDGDGPPISNDPVGDDIA
jgi:hypothetical protein